MLLRKLVVIVENLLLLNRVCWKEGLVLESLLEDRDNGSSAFEIKREKNSTGRIRSSGTQLFLIGISAFSQIEFIRTGKKGEFQGGAQRWKSIGKNMHTVCPNGPILH
ncbi:hypothetical protein Zmor_026677 [Zophobas morio]|uniref:Uncharacterized protein n=1 Tax=Zophobas morio TaxID=2755281 RepID=A0AA38M4N8_9CUCU|nr:hypothetical protein Zmor_026677 [Zophobas morio]